MPSSSNAVGPGGPLRPAQAATDGPRRAWLLGGSVVSAILASACCVGPLVFALLGLGGAGLLVKFEPLRPYFITVTLAILGAGFYFTYRRPRAAPAAEGEACGCELPRANRAGRIGLWVVTVVVAVFLVSPYLIPLLLG